MIQPAVAGTNDEAGYRLHPRYRSQRPLDDLLLKVQPGRDQFITEKYADQISAIFSEWSASLRRTPLDARSLANSFADDFSGMSLEPEESRMLRSNAGIEVRQNSFANHSALDRAEFLRELQNVFVPYSKILSAEFQITEIEADSNPSELSRISTRVRYEIVGTGADFHREQRVGYWDQIWTPTAPGDFRLQNWKAIEETQARAHSPVYVDISATALGGASSYAAQMLHGTDYWRTVLDGACGIDIYGHNGVSVGDIDNDGFDDLYVCQPAGLPNRLYRNRGDGTFEDITKLRPRRPRKHSLCSVRGFDNDGRQDLIVVRANGPLLFLNEGGGKFREKPDAFQFANPPQGTFTGAAVADYDRDGWLDIYFCLYVYYQGTDQYKYPSPYHDAENGPPNFMMRNNRDGTFRDVTAESGLNSEQHSLQLLLRMERLQPRRLARPIRGERFWPQKSLSQQRQRNIHRCCRRSRS